MTIRLFFVWLLSLVLSACAASKRVELAVSQRGRSIDVVIQNGLNRPFEFESRLLDLPTKPGRFKFVITDSTGRSIQQCGAIDYFSPAKKISVAPGMPLTLQEDARFIANSFCLDMSRVYKLQVVLNSPKDSPTMLASKTIDFDPSAAVRAESGTSAPR